MTDKELKDLKDTLWHSADILRASAHLAANKYGQPILGLIFLRYADILYKQHKDEIEDEYNRLKGSRMEKSMKEISLEKCGFYLPECAYYDFINDAPDDANKAIIVKEAMEAIEDENPRMEGVLPKEVYAQLVPEEEPEMMREQKLDSFSEFLRQNLLKKNYQDRIFESWFSLWQSQKFEQISRDVHEVLVVARENHQVTQEHVSILLTCVQELIAEVNQVQPLSRGFREKYMR